MKRILFILLCGFLTTSCLDEPNGRKVMSPERRPISRVEMNLSAYGVESDQFPSISVFIDVKKDSNRCERTYYSPKFKSTYYTLSDFEIQNLLALLNSKEFQSLSLLYVDTRPDQPTSTIIVNRGSESTTIVDSGMTGGDVLKKIYGIAYKF